MHDFDLRPAAFVAKAKAEQLSPAREAELIRAYKAGGSCQVRDELLHGVRWVSAVQAYDICKNYRCYEHFHDLFMEGQVATFTALDGFDPAYGVRFSSAYAFKANERAMLAYLHDSTGSVVQTPRRITQNGKRVRNKLSVQGDVPLDAPVNEHEEGSASHVDFVPDSRYDPALVTENRQVQRRLDQAMKRLNYRERVVVSDHLLGDATLSDLAKNFDGISGERVRQIGAAAVKKLAAVMTDATEDSATAVINAVMRKPAKAPTLVPEARPVEPGAGGRSRKPASMAQRLAAAMG